jgi:hypothetical protein
MDIINCILDCHVCCGIGFSNVRLNCFMFKNRMKFLFALEVVSWMKGNDGSKPRCLAGIKIQFHFGLFHTIVIKQEVVRTVGRIEDKHLNLIEMVGEEKLWQAEVLKEDSVDGSKLALSCEELCTSTHFEVNAHRDASEVDHAISSSAIQKAIKDKLFLHCRCGISCL